MHRWKFGSLILSMVCGVLSTLILLTMLSVQTSKASASDLFAAHPHSVPVINIDARENITLTPKSYLPIVRKNYPSCSTTPTLVSPSDGSNIPTLIPLFEWDNGNNPIATVARIDFRRFITPPGITSTVGRLFSIYTPGRQQYRRAHNLEPATTYSWIAFLLCGSEQGPYSEEWSFTTGQGGTILPAPALNAPGNGSVVTGTDVLLKWSPVSGALEYLVSWTQGDGRNVIWVTDTQTIVNLDPSSTYEWWVEARNDYAIGDSSEVWEFSTPPESSSVWVNKMVNVHGTTIIHDENVFGPPWYGRVEMSGLPQNNEYLSRRGLIVHRSGP